MLPANDLQGLCNFARLIFVLWDLALPLCRVFSESRAADPGTSQVETKRKKAKLKLQSHTDFFCESPSNSDRPPAMQAPPTRRPTSGQDGSTERTRLRATALRVQQHVPGPPQTRYHRAEVGRGMLMDGVALDQAPRVPTTEEDAARPDGGES